MRTLILAVCLGVCAPVFAQEDQEADHAALREFKTLFEKAASENQLDLLKPILHEPFSAVTYTDREFTDFEAFKTRWQKTRDDIVGNGSYKVTLKPERSEIYGDLAIARGDSENHLVTAAGNEYRFTSHWTAVFRKVDGQWKVVRVHSSLDPFGNPMVVGEVTRRMLQVGSAAAIGGLLIGGPKTADELAKTTGFAIRPLELMLQVLVALGLATRNDQGFQATPLAAMLLGGSYRNLGDEYWAHLPELLQSDEPLVRMDDVAKSEAHYQAQAAILGWMLTPAAQSAASLLKDSLPPQARILDLGAGSGIWSLTLASQTEGAYVTAVDWPAVLEVTRETAENLGLADRLQTIAGNFHEVEIPPDEFDLAIIANVTHLLKPEANRELFRKARAALRSKGRIAVIDVIPGQPAGALNVALYSLGLALRTEKGRVYSPSELETLLLSTGFGAPEIIPLAVPPFAVGVLLAQRH